MTLTKLLSGLHECEPGDMHRQNLITTCLQALQTLLTARSRRMLAFPELAAVQKVLMGQANLQKGSMQHRPRSL